MRTRKQPVSPQTPPPPPPPPPPPSSSSNEQHLLAKIRRQAQRIAQLEEQGEEEAINRAAQQSSEHASERRARDDTRASLERRLELQDDKLRRAMEEIRELKARQRSCKKPLATLTCNDTDQENQAPMLAYIGALESQIPNCPQKELDRLREEVRTLREENHRYRMESKVNKKTMEECGNIIITAVTILDPDATVKNATMRTHHQALRQSCDLLLQTTQQHKTHDEKREALLTRTKTLLNQALCPQPCGGEDDDATKATIDALETLFEPTSTTNPTELLEDESILTCTSSSSPHIDCQSIRDRLAHPTMVPLMNLLPNTLTTFIDMCDEVNTLRSQCKQYVYETRTALQAANEFLTDASNVLCVPISRRRPSSQTINEAIDLLGQLTSSLLDGEG